LFAGAVNCHLINPAEMPNAGFKHSSDGTDLSLFGLENDTRLKHVMSALG
jgi:betaine-aldehyde dehydrogenase